VKRICAIALFGVAMPAAAVQAATDLPKRPAFSTDFRTSMAHYATVDRADGKSYDLYVSLQALEAWQSERRLPVGASFAIESFVAARDASGNFTSDAQGRLIRAQSDNEIHVSEKQTAWADSADCTSQSLMNGKPMGTGMWRMGAFDPRDGSIITRASNTQGECHQCHQENRAEDFIMSRGLLDSFARSGTKAYISFTCGARDVCFGGPPTLSNKNAMPQCPDEFAKADG
jgi:hypothetical protein